MIHDLRTWPDEWEASNAGDKTFEVRKNDRGFKVGDLLQLFKWDPEAEKYVEDDSGPGRLSPLVRRVTYILPGGQFGIDPDYVVMAVVRGD